MSMINGGSKRGLKTQFAWQKEGHKAMPLLSTGS